MPLADGRFGFCHVIDVASPGARVRGWVMVEASSWIGDAAPDLNDPRLREVLVLTHHECGSETWRVMVRGPVPENFQRLGRIQLRKSGHVLGVFTSWEMLAKQVLMQWRWGHDREQLLLEEREAAERSKEDALQAAKRAKDDLDRCTLESLRTKRRFTSWSGDRPGKAVTACRKVFREAVDALIALGPKPQENAVAEVVRRCVEQLNSLDERHEGLIETVEREELCREIDEMVYVAGLRGCDGMADHWREW